MTSLLTFIIGWVWVMAVSFGAESPSMFAPEVISSNDEEFRITFTCPDAGTSNQRAGERAGGGSCTVINPKGVIAELDDDVADGVGQHTLKTERPVAPLPWWNQRWDAYAARGG